MRRAAILADVALPLVGRVGWGPIKESFGRGRGRPPTIAKIEPFADGPIFAIPHKAGGEASRLAILILPLTLAACAAQQGADAVAATAPGFWLGLWHGFIFPIAWIVSLFMDKVAVYAVPNNGGWYDFGYFLGIVVFGVGGKKSHTVYRDRVIDVKARRIPDPAS